MATALDESVVRCLNRGMLYDSSEYVMLAQGSIDEIFIAAIYGAKIIPFDHCDVANMQGCFDKIVEETRDKCVIILRLGLVGFKLSSYHFDKLLKVCKELNIYSDDVLDLDTYKNYEINSKECIINSFIDIDGEIDERITSMWDVLSKKNKPIFQKLLEKREEYTPVLSLYETFAKYLDGEFADIEKLYTDVKQTLA